MSSLVAEMTDWVRIYARPRAGAPALFLDRDGTLIENLPYLADDGAVSPIAGASQMIERFRSAGFAVVIVTNQSGIARGLVTPAQYDAVNRRMLDCLGPNLIDAVFACPFHPDGNAPFRAAHRWRKPASGMLIDAAMILELDLARSVMIGDSLSDIQAGLEAGVSRSIHVGTGHGRTERAAVMTLEEFTTGRIELVDSVNEAQPLMSTT